MSTPINGPKAGPVICVDGQGYGEHSLRQLLKRHADLERENVALREWQAGVIENAKSHHASYEKVAALREDRQRLLNACEDYEQAAKASLRENAALRADKARLVEALKLARTYVCWDDDSHYPSEYPEAEGIIKSHQQQIDAALAGKEAKP